MVKSETCEYIDIYSFVSEHLQISVVVHYSMLIVFIRQECASVPKMITDCNILLTYSYFVPVRV